MPSGTPAGLPIGRAFEIPAGLIHDELRRAVGIVESVHGVGLLPTIPLYGTRFPVLPSGIHMRRGRFAFTPEGEAVSIAIELAQEHRVLSTLHEIGHFLDLCGIGPSGRFESSFEDGTLAPWRESVPRSTAVRVLVKRAHDEESAIAQEAREQLDWREL